MKTITCRVKTQVLVVRTVIVTTRRLRAETRVLEGGARSRSSFLLELMISEDRGIRIKVIDMFTIGILAFLSVKWVLLTLSFIRLMLEVDLKKVVEKISFEKGLLTFCPSKGRQTTADNGGDFLQQDKKLENEHFSCGLCSRKLTTGRD